MPSPYGSPSFRSLAILGWATAVIALTAGFYQAGKVLLGAHDEPGPLALGIFLAGLCFYAAWRNFAASREMRGWWRREGPLA